MSYLTPKEVAAEARLSPHAVYRAIDRGDLDASEPVPGRLRIARDEFERWMATPRRRAQRSRPEPARPARQRSRDRGTFMAELKAIEGGA